jgi:hypothetical protein
MDLCARRSAVRRARPAGGHLHYSRNRNGEHPNRHLAGYTGILQADAYAGFGDLYDVRRKPKPISEAACWSHGRRKFFVIADTSANGLGAPVALEAVRRIDAIFAIEREIIALSADHRLAARQKRIVPLDQVPAARGRGQVGAKCIVRKGREVFTATARNGTGRTKRHATGWLVVVS